MAAARALQPFTELISLRKLIPFLTSSLGRRGFAAAANNNGDSEEERGPADPVPSFDPKYRSATELIWPASKHQERFASKVHSALETALLHHAGLRDALVQRLGFAVKDVRMSPDNLKAFILWDSITGQAGELQRELRAQAPRLRSAVAAALRARNAPQLVFRHDGLSPRQQEVEDIFRRLDEEAAAEAETAGPAAAGRQAAAAAGQEAWWDDEDEVEGRQQEQQQQEERRRGRRR